MTLDETNLGLPAPGRKNTETWRDLARRIETERDPAKVIEMTRELLTKLDEEGFGKKT
jgi:hypothetical protein